MICSGFFLSTCGSFAQLVLTFSASWTTCELFCEHTETTSSSKLSPATGNPLTNVPNMSPITRTLCKTWLVRTFKIVVCFCIEWMNIHKFILKHGKQSKSYIRYHYTGWQPCHDYLHLLQRLVREIIWEKNVISFPNWQNKWRLWRPKTTQRQVNGKQRTRRSGGVESQGIVLYTSTWVHYLFQSNQSSRRDMTCFWIAPNSCG